MKRVAPAALCFVLSFVSVRAYEPPAPPSPIESGSSANFSFKQNTEYAGENIFVGHFGETVRLPYFWAADAKMQGPMERVNFHFKTVDPAKVFSAPFSPEARDFVPEKFASLRLIQMLVIPKDVPGGYRSLTALREAKEKDLSATGNPYDLRKVGEYPWPPDTFWVSISTPYPLFQLYTQSDKNFFIVTSGVNPYIIDQKDPLLSNSVSTLFSSLSTYLYQFVRPSRNRITSSDVALGMLPGLLICLIALAIGFIPGARGWTRRLRLVGRTMFGLTCASLVVAAPLLVLSVSLGLDRTVNGGSLLFCAALIMPWACKVISSRLAGLMPGRVFAWSLASNALPLAVGFIFFQDFYSGKISIIGAEDLMMLTVSLSTLGLVNGVVLGLAHVYPEAVEKPGDLA